MSNAVYSLAESRRDSKAVEAEKLELVKEKRLAQQNKNYKDYIDNIIALEAQVQVTTNPHHLALLRDYEKRLNTLIQAANRKFEAEMENQMDATNPTVAYARSATSDGNFICLNSEHCNDSVEQNALAAEDANYDTCDTDDNL